MEETEIVIIGSGLSGILLGQKLHEAGKNFLILEKSPGLGGRIATRRIDGIGFDHGAPYLKSNEALNKKHSALLESAEGVFLKGGMSSLPKSLAQDLPVFKNHRVNSLKKEQGSWIVGCGDVKFKTEKVVLTAPLPQALELLEENQIPFDNSLRTVSYSKALMLLFVTRDELILEKELSKHVHSILPMAPRKLHPYGYVLRASENLSEEYFHRSDDVILMALTDLLFESTSDLLNLNHAELKKWKFAEAQTVHPEAYEEVQEGLYLIGDGFRYPDIRGPILGSEELSKLLTHIPSSN